MPNWNCVMAEQSQALFTVEQLELIRRLRLTGITKEDVIQAFDTLDQLEKELKPLTRSTVTFSHCNVHKPQALSPPSPFINTQTNTALSGQGCVFSPSSEHKSPFSHVPTSAVLTTQDTLPLNHNGVHVDLLEENFSSSNSNDFTVSYSVNSISGSTPNSIVPADLNGELNELIKKGPAVIHEEIRSFVIQNHLTQTQIASASGVSQSYISRYLRGDYSEMSESSCKAMYKWYLKTRKSGMKLEPLFVTNISGIPGSPDLLIPSLSQTDSSFPMRRERFTFRPSHLEVLERYFTNNQYPSSTQREEIASVCNDAVNKETSGRALTDKEKVYPHIVANWFANRRKEYKRLNKDNVPVRRPSGEATKLDHSSLSNESTDDQLEDQSLSMAVEVAAVNQAILSLTGQTHIEASI